MTTNDLFLSRLLPAKLIRQVSGEAEKRLKEAEESMPWWAYRRPDCGRLEKTMDLEALNILTSTYNKIR
jgi:hypothetical protein